MSLHILQPSVKFAPNLKTVNETFEKKDYFDYTIQPCHWVVKQICGFYVWYASTRLKKLISRNGSRFSLTGEHFGDLHRERFCFVTVGPLTRHRYYNQIHCVLLTVLWPSSIRTAFNHFVTDKTNRRSTIRR